MWRAGCVERGYDRTWETARPSFTVFLCSTGQHQAASFFLIILLYLLVELVSLLLITPELLANRDLCAHGVGLRAESVHGDPCARGVCSAPNLLTKTDSVDCSSV